MTTAAPSMHTDAQACTKTGMPVSTASIVGHGTSTRRASTSLKRDEIFTLIRECDALLQLEPHCLHTCAVRGHACMKINMWDRAVADFTAILNERPDDVHARFSRGMALFKGERVDEAHADFSRVLELNPHHVMARYARAGCYNTEGKFHHAIEEYTIALEHDEMANGAVHGIRHRRLSCVMPYTGMKEDEDNSSRGLQAQNAQQASPTAKEWSPTNQSEMIAKQDSVPGVSPPEPAKDPTPKPMPTKKPRKIVQVQLNLSAFVAPPAPVAPINSSPSNVLNSSMPPISKDVLNRPPQQVSTATATRAQLIPVIHSPAGSTVTPAVVIAQPRRVVRRVTVAL